MLVRIRLVVQDRKEISIDSLGIYKKFEIEKEMDSIFCRD